MWYDDVWNNRLHAVRAHRSFIHYAAHYSLIANEISSAYSTISNRRNDGISFSFCDYDILLVFTSRRASGFSFLLFECFFLGSRISRRFLFIFLATKRTHTGSMFASHNTVGQCMYVFVFERNSCVLRPQPVFLHSIHSVWGEKRRKSKTQQNRTKPFIHSMQKNCND